jgi:NTE family protein
MVGRKLLMVMAACGLSACSTVPMNEPLTALPPAGTQTAWLTTNGYRLGGIDAGTSSPDLLVALAFSGGGKRSAAFSYGALEGLRDFTITVDGRERRLLDEVDFIASVSGGSFPAAYYGLYRDKIFTDFDSDFLKRDIESYIWGIYLLPWNWEWLTNPIYGTNDAMAQIYDSLMFHGATYAKLIANGQPVVSINATDINYGAVFPFTQNQFDLLCSDLASFPIARAVAASNGFPVLFTPITLRNNAEKCGGRKPQWLDHAGPPDEVSRRRFLADVAERYLDPQKTRYVHLMDGGISDNLAMRSITDVLTIFGDDATVLRPFAQHLRRLLLISVDGQASADSAWAQQRTVYSLGQIFSAVSGTQIDRYNFETLLVANEELDRLAKNVRDVRCEMGATLDGYACDDVKTHFLHVALKDIKDPKVSERLSQIPTGLTIPDADVDLLAEQGATLIRTSKVLNEFRQSLEGAAPTTAASTQ